MLQKENRLRRADDLQRVRRYGQSWQHPLLVLLVNRSGRQSSRFAFVASRRVGTAVIRNRAKRLLRESVRLSFHRIEPGWDCLLIARPAIHQISFADVQSAVLQVMHRAGLLVDRG